MIQSTYKGIEIEMEMHQELQQAYWRYDYTLIKHPERTVTIRHSDQEFPSVELAREYVSHDARVAIDQQAQS